MKLRLFPLALFALLSTSCVPKMNTPTSPEAPAIPPPLVAGAESIVPKGTIAPGTPAYKVALLLPLSGDSAAVGNAMLDAANMALYDSYLAVEPYKIRSQVVLLPKDTGNNVAESVAAAQQGIDQGAQFIIGPLFSQSVTAIAPIAKQHKIDMLTFSNNKAVASGGVYVFGFLPEQQINRMAEYAYLHGLQRIAVLAPNDPYGQKVKDMIIDIYSKKGGTVSPAEVYAPSPANIDAAVSRLSSAYHNVTEDKRFQAVFIPDGIVSLKNIIASFKKTSLDLDKIKLIGTGLWDDPDVAKIPEMKGAWYPSVPAERYDAFEKRFTTLYGYKPIRLASLSYDAVALAATVSMSSTKGINSSTLANTFESPANGIIRLRSDGMSERPLAMFEIGANGEPKIIEQPPANF